MQKASIGGRGEKENQKERGGTGDEEAILKYTKGPFYSWLQNEGRQSFAPCSELSKKSGQRWTHEGVRVSTRDVLENHPGNKPPLSSTLYGERGDPTYLEVFNDEMVISTEPVSAVKFALVPEGSLNVSCARSLNCFSSSLWNSIIGMGTQNLSFQSTRVGS